MKMVSPEVATAWALVMVLNALPGSVPLFPLLPLVPSTIHAVPCEPMGTETGLPPSSGMPKEVTPFGKFVNPIAALLLLQKLHRCRWQNPLAFRSFHSVIAHGIFGRFEHPVTNKCVLYWPIHVHRSGHLVKDDDQRKRGAWKLRLVSVVFHLWAI